MTTAPGPGRAWPADTEVVRLATAGDRSLVEARLRSGVTHQVRVHLAARGHPIVGDGLYGGTTEALPSGRHALHASRIVPGGRVADLPSFESPLPADLRALLERGLSGASGQDRGQAADLPLPPRGSFAVAQGVQRLLTLFGSSTSPSSMLWQIFLQDAQMK